MTARLLAAVGWLGLFVIYLVRMPGTFFFEDCPELLACASTLGNTHEPGYPLLALAGRLATAVPLGCPAMRFNMLGAAAAAGAALILGGLAASCARRNAARPIAYSAGAFAALTWSLSETFWWQAMIGEKYPLFYLAFAGAALLAWRRVEAGGMGPLRLPLGIALFWGLGLAHHPFLLMAFPLLLVSLAPLGTGLRTAAPRALMLALVLGLLPLSVKLMYPPVRSSAGVNMDWGGPSNLPRMLRYVSGGRYLGSEAPERRTARRYLDRLMNSMRRTATELPLLLIAAAPLGAVRIAREGRGMLAALLATGLLSFLFVSAFPERVVRWQQPAHAVIVLLAACGLAEMCQSFLRIGWRRTGTALMPALAILAAIMQWETGRMRNRLSSFYGAHDMGRNLLISLPPNALYLGRGDTDLFPLWALREVEGSRGDVVALGLGSLVDANPADRGMLRLFRLKTGFAPKGWELLRFLAGKPAGLPVMIAKTGYPDELWRGLGRNAVHQARGIAGQLSPKWEFGASERMSRRLFSVYSLRGVTHARQGPFGDPGNLREELALDALLHYADSLVSFGAQSCHYGEEGCSAWAFRRAARLLMPFSGLPWEMAPAASARAWALWAAEGYAGLARQFSKRGSPQRAERYLASAAMCRSAAAASSSTAVP